MKTVLNIEKFNSGKIANYVNNAQSAGSDNGLSANYRTAIIPVIVSKKIASSGTEFGAFVTALFD